MFNTKSTLARPAPKMGPIKPINVVTRDRSTSVPNPSNQGQPRYYVPTGQAPPPIDTGLRMPGENVIIDNDLLDRFNSLGLGLEYGASNSATPEELDSKSNGSSSPTSNDTAVKSIVLYKTEMCASFMASGACRYKLKCKFAHGFHELRPVSRHPKYKSTLCRNFLEHGFCPYGKRCCFLHKSMKDLQNMEKSQEFPAQPVLSNYLPPQVGYPLNESNSLPTSPVYPEPQNFNRNFRSSKSLDLRNMSFQEFAHSEALRHGYQVSKSNWTPPEPKKFHVNEFVPRKPYRMHSNYEKSSNSDLNVQGNVFLPQSARSGIDQSMYMLDYVLNQDKKTTSPLTSRPNYSTADSPVVQ